MRSRFLQTVPFICLSIMCLSTVSVFAATQTDWSGGSGVPGPVYHEFLTNFDTSADIDYRLNPGALSLDYQTAETTLGYIPSWVSGIQSVDMDGDGHLDIVVGYVGYLEDHPTGVAWYRNSGDYQTYTKVTVMEEVYYQIPRVRAIHVIDMDGDGDMDILVARGDNFYVYLNNNGVGTSWGVFPLPGTYDTTYSIHGVDMDGDGDMDVVGSAWYKTNVVWFRNDGGGIVTPIEIDCGVHERPTCVYPVDLDGDGDLDILVASAHGTAGFFWLDNDGIGNFTKRTILSGMTDAVSVIAVDIDGDGDLDVIGHDDSVYGSGKVILVKNLGGSPIVWSEPISVDTIQWGAAYSRSINAIDIDGDGHLDIVSAKSPGGDPRSGLMWYRNRDGLGNSWSKHSLNSAVQKCCDVFTRNGQVYVVVAGGDLKIIDPQQFSTSGELVSSILDPREANPIWGTIEWQADVPGSASIGVSVRGSDDYSSLGGWITIPSSGSDLSDYLTGFPRFIQYKVALASPVQPDLLAPFFEEVSINWTNPPAPTPTSVPTGPPGVCESQDDWSGGYALSPVTAWTTFFDSSAGIDTGSSGKVSLQRELRDPIVKHGILGNGDVPYDVAVADFNNDGYDDVVVTEILISNKHLAWHSNNNGFGTDWTKHIIGTGYTSEGHQLLEVADMNGDGNTDVILGHSAGIVWWANTDNGIVWTEHTITSTFGTSNIKVADIDGDGDLDVVATAPYMGDTVVWFRNEGQGLSWTEIQVNTSALHPTPGGLALGDINGDGTIDIALSNWHSPTGIHWYSNDSGDGLTWTLSTIEADTGKVTNLRLADFNCDSTLDVLACDTDEDNWGWAWYSNDNGTGKDWTFNSMPHLPGSWYTFDIRIYDLTGNGTPDIVVTNRTNVFFCENINCGESFTYHAIEPNPWCCYRGVDVGDFDGNGTHDVVRVDSLDYHVDWLNVLSHVSSGAVESCVLDVGGTDHEWKRITWDSDVPLDTSIQVSIRAADNPGSMPLWQAVNFGDDLTAYVTDGLRYIQYRVDLNTINGDFGPGLSNITICRDSLSSPPPIPATGPPGIIVTLILLGTLIRRIRRPRM